MSIRSYGQHCGLAAAMDLVGQRWAMLVVRELTPGPRRFTDLHDGLPGVATDVLAERLRELVAAGVVEHRATGRRGPAGSAGPAKVYELTESGRELASIAQRLAAWGMPLLPVTPDDGRVVRARWALQTMAMAYRGGAPDGDHEFVIDGEVLRVHVDGDRATMHYGPSADGAIVRLRCTAKHFFTASKHPGWVSAPRRGVEIDGDPEVLARVLAAMPLSADAATR